MDHASTWGNEMTVTPIMQSMQDLSRVVHDDVKHLLGTKYLVGRRIRNRWRRRNQMAILLIVASVGLQLSDRFPAGHP